MVEHQSTQHHAFERQLAEAWPPDVWQDVTVIVAISGGADSVALLLALTAISRQQPGQLIAAHFNHQLRRSESEEDERFVRQLCDSLSIDCEVGHAERAIASQGDGLEIEARRHRYAFLRRVASRRGARYVATAHTADDQAETVLHRVLRGTAVAGLAGIPITRPISEMTTLVRPMLSIQRRDVLAYLDDRGQDFREDSSNSSMAFTRNRIRHELLPLLAGQFNGQVVAALVRLGNSAREAQQVIDTVVAPLVEQAVVRRSATEVEVRRSVLHSSPPYVVREVFVRIWKDQDWPRQDMSEAKWKQLCQVVQAASPGLLPRFSLPAGIQAEVRGDTLCLSRC